MGLAKMAEACPGATSKPVVISSIPEISMPVGSKVFMAAILVALRS